MQGLLHNLDLCGSRTKNKTIVKKDINVNAHRFPKKEKNKESTEQLSPPALVPLLVTFGHQGYSPRKKRKVPLELSDGVPPEPAQDQNGRSGDDDQTATSTAAATQLLIFFWRTSAMLNGLLLGRASLRSMLRRKVDSWKRTTCHRHYCRCRSDDDVVVGVGRANAHSRAIHDDRGQRRRDEAPAPRHCALPSLYDLSPCEEEEDTMDKEGHEVGEAQNEDRMDDRNDGVVAGKVRSRQGEEEYH